MANGRVRGRATGGTRPGQRLFLLPPNRERAAFTARSTTPPRLFVELLLLDFFELPPFFELPELPPAFFEELDFFEELLAFPDELLALFDEPLAFFEELLAFFEELPPALPDEPPAFFDDDELLAFFEELLLAFPDELLPFFEEEDEPPFLEEPPFPELDFEEPPPLAAAVSRETSLLKRFPSSSESSSAKALRSNHSKNSSHSISSSVSSPLKPGKSIRRIPGSFPVPVAATRAGCPPRASTHCRISSWSVVGCAVAITTPSVVSKIPCRSIASET